MTRIPIEDMAAVCKVPWPLPPGLVRESVERRAAAHDAATAACVAYARDRRYIRSIELKPPRAPDPRVFGDPDAMPPWRACAEGEYHGPLVTCPFCRASWHGSLADPCWICEPKEAG